VKNIPAIFFRKIGKYLFEGVFLSLLKVRMMKNTDGSYHLG